MCKTCVNTWIWIGIKIERQILIRIGTIHNTDFLQY